MDNEKVYAMSFAKIYPLLVAKAERKGRTLEEVNEIICWLTGYNLEQLETFRVSFLCSVIIETGHRPF